MTAKVVDLRSRNGDGTTECLLRFVWPGSGPVQLVPVAGDVTAFRNRVAAGIAGPSGLLYPEDGEPFIDNVHEEFRGSYLWATKPRLVDDRALANLLQLSAGESPPAPEA